MNMYFDIALNEAVKSFKRNDVPIGAVLVIDGKIIAKAGNNRHSKKNVLGHAEIIVINKGTKKIKNWRLDGADLYVSLKPCKMCMEVIREAKIANVYYLLDPLDIKENRYESTCNVVKVDNNNMACNYKELLNEFFVNKR